MQSKNYRCLKDAQSLFEYQCTYGHTSIKPRDKGIFALVLAAKMNDHGVQDVAVKVAARDGGFQAFATTLKPNRPCLKPGDPVIWVPMEHEKNVAEEMGDERCGWIGFIAAKVSLTDGHRGSFEIVEEYA
jgi:hypothetical protein